MNEEYEDATSRGLLRRKRGSDDPLPVNAWAIAGLVVLVAISAMLMLGRHRHGGFGGGILPPDPYAAQLPLSGFTMSESTSLSGGKSTFVDGVIRNTGPKTISAITVQVLFKNDEGMPPQIETLPLALIRVREPYIDTEPVSLAPIKPGEEREFRLIFEKIAGNWNTQVPEIRIVRVR